MSSDGVRIAILKGDCGIREPVEIVGYKLVRRLKKHDRDRGVKRYAEILVQKCHPLIADGWTLKQGRNRDYIPISFNGDALPKILRHQILVELDY